MSRPMNYDEHLQATRRFFLQVIAGGASSALLACTLGADEIPADCEKACEEFLKKMEYLTPQAEFRNVSRGNPKPHDLPDEKKQEVGLTPETWKLEVVSDPDNPADLGEEFTQEAGNAIDWKILMKLAEEHSVRFAKVITCNNIGRPLGMGIWEGVPLRKIIWMTRPKQNLRRVFYTGYHNDDPKQIFRSSLPIGRVLEDPLDLPPVILCYKLNGHLLTSERGAPVRIVVPEAYGFKSVKWLNRLVLSNISHANDTYAEANNDVDSGMKTFAQIMLKPNSINEGEPIPITGYAQVGVSGLVKVQTLISPQDKEWPAGDPYYTKADWTDAHILPPPKTWGGDLPDGKLPTNIHQFNSETSEPNSWPLRLTMAHWATVLSGLPVGKYTFRCRTIDSKGHAQPMPRPFRKSGRNKIEAVEIEVT
jgi:DMSO/TMAO reductase YedYZ molybdopterin-dependent catalytic subunit